MSAASIPGTSAFPPGHLGFPNQPFPRLVGPGATLISNSGDGGTQGTAVTLGNSGGASGTAFSTVSAGASNTITYDQGAAIHGGLGFLFTKGSTAASLVELTDTGTGVDGSTSVGIRYYLNMRDGLPATAAALGCQMRNVAGGQLPRIEITTAGLMQVAGVSGIIGTGTVPLLGGVVYRFEKQWSGLNTPGAGRVDAQVFAQDSLVPIDQFTVTGITQLGLCGPVRFGNTGVGAQPSFIMDSLAIRVGSNAPIGPLISVLGDLGPTLGPVGIRRRLIVVPGLRRRPAESPLTQTVAPAQPPYVPPDGRNPSRGVPARRGRIVHPPMPPAGPGPASPGRRRARAVIGRRAPEQPSPPFPQTVAPVAPPYPVVDPRPWRVVLGLRRRPGVAWPVPPQAAAPVAPPYIDPGRTRRRAGIAAVLRRRPTTIPLEQAVVPVRPGARRRFVWARSRPGTEAVPPFRQVVPPVYPRQGLRRRLIGVLLRRPRPVVDPVRPGNPNTTIPRPGTVEPGSRGGPSAGSGVRGGPGVSPGTRSSSSGVPGVRRGGDNEPGTRSGPTISGGH